jgi:hypothetical protein
MDDMATNQEQPIGFGGLDTFITPIEPALAEADRLSLVEPTPTTPEYEEPPAEPMHRDWGALGGLGRGLGSLAGIGLSIVVVVGIKACASAALSNGGSSSTDYSASSSPSYAAASTDSSDASQSSDSGDASSTVATTDDSTASSGDVDSTEDSSTAESAPSPSELGGRYNAAEVRYCLSEEVRVDGAKDYMNELQATDPSEFNLRVDRFNDMVSDWNSRCSRFSYASGTMASIQSEVDAQRQALESEGRSKLQ